MSSLGGRGSGGGKTCSRNTRTNFAGGGGGGGARDVLRSAVVLVSRSFTIPPLLFLLLLFLPFLPFLERTADPDKQIK